MLSLSRRNMLRGVAFGAAAVGNGALRNARAQQPGPIRIPYIVTLSGPLALVGTQIQIGAQITADIINKSGGIMGRPVNLIFRDDKGKPEEAVAAMREMIGDGMHIVIGGLTGPTTLPLLDIAKETKSVLLTTAVGMPITHELYNRYVFRSLDNEYQRLRGLARLAAERFPDVQSWGGVLTDTETYKTSYDNFTKLLSKYIEEEGKQAPKIAEAILAKSGSTDFHSQIAQMSSLSLDAVYNQVSGSDSVTFWQQARAFGLTKNIKVVLDQSIDIVAAKALRMNLPPSLWTILPWYPKLYPDNPMSKALYDGYVERTKDRYASGYLQHPNTPLLGIAAAVDAANGTTDPESVIAALEGLKFNTAKGEVYFRKEDHQAVEDTCFIKIEAREQDPGFTITDSYKIPGLELLEPPNPGVKFTP